MFQRLMEEISKLRQNVDQRNAREYEKHVRYAAELTGQPTAKRVEETERALSKLNITPEQFKADVDRLEELRRLEPLAKRRQELCERLFALKEKLKAFDAAFVEARKQFHRDRRELEHEISDVGRARFEADEAYRRLGLEYPDSAIGQEWATQEAKLAHRNRVREAEAAQHRIEQTIEITEKKLRSSVTPRQERKAQLTYKTGWFDSEPFSSTATETQRKQIDRIHRLRVEHHQAVQRVKAAKKEPELATPEPAMAD